MSRLDNDTLIAERRARAEGRDFGLGDRRERDSVGGLNRGDVRRYGGAGATLLNQFGIFDTDQIGAFGRVIDRGGMIGEAVGVITGDRGLESVSREAGRLGRDYDRVDRREDRQEEAEYRRAERQREAEERRAERQGRGGESRWDEGVRVYRESADRQRGGESAYSRDAEDRQGGTRGQEVRFNQQGGAPVTYESLGITVDAREALANAVMVAHDMRMPPSPQDAAAYARAVTGAVGSDGVITIPDWEYRMGDRTYRFPAGTYTAAQLGELAMGQRTEDPRARATVAGAFAGIGSQQPTAPQTGVAGGGAAAIDAPNTGAGQPVMELDRRETAQFVNNLHAQVARALEAGDREGAERAIDHFIRQNGNQLDREFRVVPGEGGLVDFRSQGGAVVPNPADGTITPREIARGAFANDPQLLALFDERAGAARGAAAPDRAPGAGAGQAPTPSVTHHPVGEPVNMADSAFQALPAGERSVLLINAPSVMGPDGQPLTPGARLNAALAASQEALDGLPAEATIEQVLGGAFNVRGVDEAGRRVVDNVNALYVGATEEERAEATNRMNALYDAAEVKYPQYADALNQAQLSQNEDMARAARGQGGAAVGGTPGHQQTPEERMASLQGMQFTDPALQQTYDAILAQEQQIEGMGFGGFIGRLVFMVKNIVEGHPELNQSPEAFLLQNRAGLTPESAAEVDRLRGAALAEDGQQPTAPQVPPAAPEGPQAPQTPPANAVDGQTPPQHAVVPEGSVDVRPQDPLIAQTPPAQTPPVQTPPVAGAGEFVVQEGVTADQDLVVGAAQRLTADVTDRIDTDAPQTGDQPRTLPEGANEAVVAAASLYVPSWANLPVGIDTVSMNDRSRVAVVSYQEDLVAAGLLTNANGVQDAQTVEALRTAERLLGRPVDGNYDQALADALAKPEVQAAIRAAVQGNTVTGGQQADEVNVNVGGPGVGLNQDIGLGAR